MQIFKQRITATAVMLFASCTLFSAAGYAQNTGKNLPAVERNKIDNTPKSLLFPAGSGPRLSDAAAVLGEQLGLQPSSPISLVLKSTTTTKAGITTLRYTEYYKGIKVEHGAFTVTGKDGLISFMTGDFFAPATDLSTTPALTESAALTHALNFVGADLYKWQVPQEEAHIKKLYNNPDTSYMPHGTLVWVEDRRDDQEDRKLRLAYCFDVYAQKPLSRQDIYIDAITGKVLFSNSRIKHVAASGASRYSGVVPFQTSFDFGTFRMYDATRGSGVHTMNMNNGTFFGSATEITSPTNTWPNIPANNVALDAHWGGAIVYDYFFTEHGRLSWDNLDGQLKQYIHYGVDFNNAFWDGVAMTYGDGSGIAAGGFSPLTSIDVTAHEVGHGVCEATAGLVYESESGALNEGFSDCWAATVEHWADPLETDVMPKAHWEMGEEIGTEPMRSLNAPLLQNQPNTYGSTNWVSVVSCTPGPWNDYCGVHTNSGLLNYWYYLLVNGGSGTNGVGNAYVVNTLGWTKSAAVLYQTELALTSLSTYADARTASINAAITLYGACSPEVQAVTSAWYAVNVGPNYVPCTPQIGFTATTLRISEKSTATTCPATKTVSISLKPNGPTTTGGSPVANIIVASSSTAVLGVDFTLSATSITFPVGDMSARNITVTIPDNGTVFDDKRIDLAFTVTPAGSGAVINPTADTMQIFIDNDDSVPHVGGISWPQLNAGIPVTADLTTPFRGTNRRARAQYILYANELAAAGVIPGAPISQIAFNVLSKSSTAPFVGFTVSMGHTTNTELSSAFVTGLTQVYTGNLTTNLGLDSIDFNTGAFSWNGTSNIVVQFCYGMNAATFSGNDQVAGIKQGAYFIGDYNVTNSGTGSGCGLGFDAANRTVIRPAMRFKQTVAPTTVETTAASNRTWNVRSGQEVYFYNPTTSRVIAGVKNSTHDLGCVTATVSQAGNGVTPAIFSDINRSRKEITVTPTTSGGVATYDVTIYLTTTELAGITPSSLFLLKTNAPTDATVSNSNSVLITPTIITAGNYVGFRGTFTGFSRFMLVDGPLCNTPDANITPAGPTTFCTGGSVVLNANTGTGLTYQWQIDGADIPGATSVAYTASIGGSYTVRVNRSACDSTSTAVSVVVNTAAVAPISGSSTVCLGTPSILTDATAGGTWSSSNTAVATITASGVVSGVATGTATISYTATGPCGTATATYIVTVAPIPAVTSITGVFTKCMGTPVTLSSTTPGGTWSSSNIAVANVSPTGVVTSTALGTATVNYTVTNGFGCTASAAEVITVYGVAAPSVSITASPNDTVCNGSPVTYSALPTFGGTAPLYLWTENGVNVATGPTYSTVPENGDIILCTITSNYECLTSSTATSAPFIMRVLPTVANTVSISASSTSVAAGTVVSFVAVAPYAASYQWRINGVPVSGATSATFTTAGLSNGQVVTCAVTTTAMCATPSSVISGGITMNVTTGIADNVTESLIISPNPNNGAFSVSGSVLAQDDFAITVVNMLGQTVYSGTLAVNNGQVDQTISLSAALPSGSYIVKIASGHQHLVYQMTLTR